jgi:DNA helicase-2/ATP-dependent DNA helicase PcrA
MEEALRKHNIPYRIYGGMHLLAKKFKDFLAIRGTSQFKRQSATKTIIINYPARGIEDTTLNRLIAATGQIEGGLWNVLTQVEFIPGIKISIKALTDFRTLIDSFPNK